MSAFICSPEHVAVLAAFAATNAVAAYQRDSLQDTAKAIADGLMRQNIRSMCDRYSDGKVYLDLQKKAAALAKKYTTSPPAEVRALCVVDIIKMASCLDYQSCESDDYDSTDAAIQIRWIAGKAHRMLDGWDDAVWEFQG